MTHGSETETIQPYSQAWWPRLSYRSSSQMALFFKKGRQRSIAREKEWKIERVDKRRGAAASKSHWPEQPRSRRRHLEDAGRIKSGGKTVIPHPLLPSRFRKWRIAFVRPEGQRKKKKQNKTQKKENKSKALMYAHR